MQVVFENVTKNFGSIVALENISFKVKQGEFVFVIGPSGAGKTTLIRLILAQFLPSAGKIYLDEKDLAGLSLKEILKLRRKIGVAFQEFCLVRDKTSRENISLPLDICGLDQKEKEIKINKALKATGLHGRENFFPAQLSGGEVQRCCLARALVNSPSLVLADEPTGNLDPETSWQIIKILKNFNKKGATVIMATHNFDIVNSLKERVLYLDKGRLVKDKKEGKYFDR